MLSSVQYKKILLLNTRGHSIRNISKLSGYSRKTVSKVLRIKNPLPFNRPLRPSKLDNYRDCIRVKLGNGINTLKIYDEISRDGYNGSYSTLRRYVSMQVKDKRLALNNCAHSKLEKKYHHIEWVLRLLQGMISLDEIKMHFEKYMDIDSIDKLYFYILNNSLRYRNRSITIFSHMKKSQRKQSRKS